MERVFIWVGRAAMVLGMAVGVYAFVVGVMGSDVGMGAMAKQMKAMIVSLGLFSGGFFFARAGSVADPDAPLPGEKTPSPKKDQP